MRGVAAIAERRLVVNADDFGFTAGVNRGILEAFEAGALRSASIMVGTPGFDDAARATRLARGRLGVGLHLTLTNGRPLTKCPSLVHGSVGALAPLRTLLWRAVTGRIVATEVADECTAQIERCRAAGLRLTHLDGHQHVHTLPVICDAVRAVARRERIRFWRRPRERIRIRRDGSHRLLQRLAIAALARNVPHDSTSPGPRTTDYFAGGGLLGAPDVDARLLQIFDTLPNGTTELMVHPGYVDGPLPGDDGYTEGRERELRALTSPEVLARLHRGDIELTHFGAL